MINNKNLLAYQTKTISRASTFRV